MIKNPEFENWKTKRIEEIKTLISDSGTVKSDILNIVLENAYIQGGNAALTNELKKVQE